MESIRTAKPWDLNWRTAGPAVLCESFVEEGGCAITMEFLAGLWVWLAAGTPVPATQSEVRLSNANRA